MKYSSFQKQNVPLLFLILNTGKGTKMKYWDIKDKKGLHIVILRP